MARLTRSPMTKLEAIRENEQENQPATSTFLSGVRMLKGPKLPRGSRHPAGSDRTAKR
jgi:hypothetical protein